MNNKLFGLRAMVLDRLLKKPDGVSAREMLSKVNQSLTETGAYPLKRRDTILNDLQKIENRHHIPIKFWKDENDKRIIRYRYEKTTDSIFKYPLTPQQVAKIKGALDLLIKFKGIPQYTWVNELCSHFDVVCEPFGDKVVHFEESCCDTGMQYFTPLFHAILDQDTVTITYQRYGQKERKHTIFPYYLKQCCRRWYLIARRNSKHMSSICVFSLDRIISLDIDNSVKYVPSGMYIDEYFKDVYGVTRHDGVEPITIHFYVTANQLPYLLTNPIHESQKLIEEDESGAILSIHVIPNYELMMKFLSYSDGVIVLTKCLLRDDIIKKLKNMLKNYESSKLAR